MASIGSLLGNVSAHGDRNILHSGTGLVSAGLNFSLPSADDPATFVGRTPCTPNTLSTPLHDRDGAIPVPQLQ